MFTSLYSRRNSIRVILSLKYVTTGSFRSETLEHSRTVHDIVKAAKVPTYSALGTRCFGATTDKVCLLDESEFHLIADETLEELVGYLDTLENSLDDLEVDLSVSCSAFLPCQCLVVRFLLNSLMFPTHVVLPSITEWRPQHIFVIEGYQLGYKQANP